MPKRRIKIKNYLIFILIVSSVTLSYFYSREVYTFFMRSYYEKIRGRSIEQQLSRAREMYRNREYTELEEYLRTLIIVYPENRDLRKLEGLTLIKLGKRDRGVDMILTAGGDEPMPEVQLEETVSALFEQKRYGDIAEIFKKNSPGANPNLLYYYGVSLFETEKYAGSTRYLKRAIEEGRRDYKVYHYIGRAYVASGDTRASLPYLDRARNLNVEDPDVANSLAGAYQKLGRYDDAARILRKMKR
ncbi:MAG: hypothetical protein A2176_05350 [Spirochaetes bacterium RBG_13_51_14]|nr:MAG: hypothetical protein A2176_05350 [Spirochaetes bacterium RBG_13_51_14]